MRFSVLRRRNDGRGDSRAGNPATAHHTAQLQRATAAHAPGSHKVSRTQATAQHTAR
jgi:hypothetical protein